MNKFLLFLASAFNCVAQLPDTDLWLVRLSKAKDQMKIEKAENITNRAGYDNQPAFSSNGKKIFYVSIREDKQADIFAYDIKSKKHSPFTKTSESEYSPTLSPDGRHLVCVAVMADSSQYLLKYDLENGKGGEPLTKPGERIGEIDSVGYFTFLNADTVLYYKLTTPHTLRAQNLINGKDARIAVDPIRGFKKINRREFIYGIKDSGGVNFYRYDAVILKARPYCRYNSKAEDISWHSPWGLLKSEKSQILRYDDRKTEWLTFLDFSSFGIKEITRFAFDEDNTKLVIIENK